MKKISVVKPPNGKLVAPEVEQMGRPQRGFDSVFEPVVGVDALRRMDHTDWLDNFAKVMKLQTGVEMTPMRAGVISRVNLASQFIELLQSDIRAAEQKMAEATAEILRLRKRGDPEDVELEEGGNGR